MDWQKKLTKPEYISLFTTLFCGIAVHLFALTNVIHNYDDIAAYPIGLGTGVSSGRWLLEIMNRWFIHTGGAYNLAYLNGALFIILISIASFFLVSALKIKSAVVAGLMGACFIVFPTAVSILMFRFTCHAYGLSVLLTVLAVWVCGKFVFSFFVSAVLLALSLGLYQAYLPLTVSLFVLLLIRNVLEDENFSFRKHFLRGLLYCGIIILALGIHFTAQNICLNIYGASLSGYKGIGSSYELSKIPSLMIKAASSFLLMPIKDYCNIANIASIRKAYILLWLLTAFLLCICAFTKKHSSSRIVMLLLLCAVFPFAVNLIVIMAPEANVYTMMVYSFVCVLWLPLLLLDILSNIPAAKSVRVIKNSTTIIVAFIILSYSYYANANYSTAYFATKQTENYINSMITQIRMTEGFDAEKKWAIIGELKDPLLENRWELAARYGGVVTSSHLLRCYSRYDWIRVYMGYKVPLVEQSTVELMKTSGEYKAMPCWPSAGSVNIIDDIVVVKLSDD